MAAVEPLQAVRGSFEAERSAMVVQVEEVGVGTPDQIRKQKRHEYVDGVVVSTADERCNAQKCGGCRDEPQDAAFAVREPNAGRKHKFDGVAREDKVSAAPEGKPGYGHLDGINKAAWTAILAVRAARVGVG